MLNTTELSFFAHSSGKDDIIGWILKVRKRCLHMGEEVGGVQSLCEPCSIWTWWHVGFWRHVIRCDCQHYASERVPAQGTYRHTDDGQNTKLYSQKEVTFLIRQYLTVLRSRFVYYIVGSSFAHAYFTEISYVDTRWNIRRFVDHLSDNMMRTIYMRRALYLQASIHNEKSV